MRTFTLIFLMPVLFSSCISYQYLTLSANETTLDQQNRIVKQVDSIMVTYDFSGKNGPITIKVFNKSTQPIEVDWRRSSLIIGDKPKQMFPSEVKINGEISRSGFRGASTSPFRAEMEQPAGVDFIPPRSVVSWHGLTLRPGRFDLSRYPTTQDKMKADAGFQKKYQKSTFSHSGSPYKVRIYLTLLGPETGERLFAIDQEFYVSEIMEINAAPHFLAPSKGSNGNRFYVNF